MLPRQMPLEARPHFARKLDISGPAQVTQQDIEEDHVHVVMVFRQGSVGVQQIFLARQLRAGIGWPGCGISGCDGRCVLPFQPMPKLGLRTIMASHRIENIRAPPSCKSNPPGYTAVHDALLYRVPKRIRNDTKGGCGRIQIRIGRVETDRVGDLFHLAAPCVEITRRITVPDDVA